jgi:hypothetical protein
MNLDATSLNVQKLDLDEMKKHQGGTFLETAVGVLTLVTLTIKLGEWLYEKAEKYFTPRLESRIA